MKKYYWCQDMVINCFKIELMIVSYVWREYCVLKMLSRAISYHPMAFSIPAQPMSHHIFLFLFSGAHDFLSTMGASPSPHSLKWIMSWKSEAIQQNRIAKNHELRNLKVTRQVVGGPIETEFCIVLRSRRSGVVIPRSDFGVRARRHPVLALPSLTAIRTGVGFRQPISFLPATGRGAATLT
jgi:hypothetical protein